MSKWNYRNKAIPTSFYIRFFHILILYCKQVTAHYSLTLFQTYWPSYSEIPKFIEISEFLTSRWPHCVKCPSPNFFMGVFCLPLRDWFKYHLFVRTFLSTLITSRFPRSGTLSNHHVGEDFSNCLVHISPHFHLIPFMFLLPSGGFYTWLFSCFSLLR